MSTIDNVMSHEAAIWINQRVEELPNRAKHRASNSIRSLNWANHIYASGLPIPAYYCALHATEEAVAAFISCAKECGYEDASSINIRDHQAKATVSLMVEKITQILQPYSPAIALKSDVDSLAVRFTKDGEYRYDIASTKTIFFVDENSNPATGFYDHLLSMFDNTEDLKRFVKLGQEARNKLFYADKTGYPKEPDDPELSMMRECHISLGLIWASIDIYRHKDEKIPLIVQALHTAKQVITEAKGQKRD